MKSKKIAASTMAMLMGISTVAPSTSMIFANSIVASADDSVTSDANDVAKLNKVAEVIGYEVQKYQDKADAAHTISAGNTETLAQVIKTVFARANNITNGMRFYGENVDGTTLGYEGSGNGTVAVKSFSSSDANVQAVLVFTSPDGKTTKEVSVTVPVTKAEETVTASTISNKVYEALNKLEKDGKYTASTSKSDLEAVIKGVVSAYSGASYDITSYSKDPSDIFKTTNIEWKVTYNKSTWTNSTWLSVSNKEAFEEVKANALKAIKETKIYSSSANVTAVKEAVSESLDNVHGIDSYEITSIKSYTPAQLGKEGNFAGSVKIVCLFDESLSATLDFDVTIPAITQTADQQLAQINEAVKKAVADYKYKTSSATTVEELQKIAQDEAAKKGAALTPNGNFTKEGNIIRFEYTITYPGAKESITDEASVTIVSLEDKVSAAITDVKKAINDYKATNATTAEDFLKIANTAAAKYGVSLVWNDSDPFVKKLAVDTADGAISGSIKFAGTNTTVSCNKVISASGITVSDKLAAAKASAEKRIKEWVENGKYTPTELTGWQSAVYVAMQDALGNAYFPINGQDASLSSYKLEEPTYTAGGKVEGTVVLKYDDGSTKASIEVPFSYDIEKLYTADENVVRAKDALEKYFSEYKGATAATTSDDILQIAKNEVESKYGVKVSYAQKYGDTDILLVNDKNAKKITGSLVVSAKGASKTATAAVNIDYTVSDTFSDAVKLANETVAAFKATNKSTAQDVKDAILKALTDAKFTGYTVEDTVDALTVTKATDTAAGSIKGSLYLKGANKTEVISVNIEIGSLKNKDEILDGAKKAVETKLADTKASNDAKADDILSYAEEAVKAYAAAIDGNPDIKVSWNTAEGFKLTPATTKEEGKITGKIDITYGGIVVTADVAMKIDQLAQTNEEVLKGAKKAADDKLAKTDATNETTSEALLKSIKEAVADYASKLDGKPEIKVSWNDDDAFKLTPATSDAAGKIVGTLDITYNGTTVTTKVDLDISKLPAPSIKVEKVAVSDKFTATSGVVRINWTALKDVDGYRVYRLDPVSGKYKVVKTLHDGSLNTFRITGLDSATEYTFAVKAFVNDEDGAAHYGPVSDAIKTATDPLATQVTKSSSSKSAVRLYYKESKGADGYKIQKYNTSTKKWETVKITSKTNYKVKGLNSKTSYKFRVQAFKRTSGKKLYSAWSTAYTAKTK